MKKLSDYSGMRHLFSKWWNYAFATLTWPVPLELVTGIATVQTHGHALKFTTRRTRASYFQEIRRGRWEPEVIDFICQCLSPGDTFLDVGAWIGFYSLLASQLVGASGRVYAFEPDPTARASLEENVRLARVCNIQVIPLGLSDFEGEADMVGCGGSGSQVVCQRTDASFRCSVTTLDKFVSSHDILPSFVKIDVEGHEDAVLAGGQHTLGKPEVDTVIEFHEQHLADKGIDPNTVYRSIFELGKLVFLLDNKTNDSFGSPLSPHARPTGRCHLLLTSRASLYRQTG